MSDRTPDAAERDTRNRGLEEEDKRQHEPDGHPPHRAVDHDKAQPKPDATTPVEEDEDDIAHLENPPQSDGPRERSNDGV